MVAGVLRGVTGVGRAEGVVVAVGVGVAAFRDGREAAVARGRVARVGRADVAVVADHRRPPLALARLRVAGLDPVAGVVVVAVGVRLAAVRDRRMHAAYPRLTAVGGAGVGVVAVGRGARDAAVVHARLGPVAHVAVVTVPVVQTAAGDRRVDAAGRRIAGVRRAHGAVVAVGRGVRAARGGIAAVVGAGVAVVAVEGGPSLALARLRVAGLHPVAGVVVVAVGVRLAAARDWRIHAAARAAVGRRVAAVGRAHAPVIAGRGRAGHALPSRRVAGLEAVAELAVVAGDSGRVVADVLLGVTGVGRAEAVVVAVGVDVAASCDRREAAVARGRVA